LAQVKQTRKEANFSAVELRKVQYESPVELSPKTRLHIFHQVLF